MAHNLTETDAYTANVSVPDAADARTAASVETPFQALTNRAKYLYTRLTRLSGFYADGTFQLGIMDGVSKATSWEFIDDCSRWYSLANSLYVAVPICADVLPHNATLTGFSVRVEPGAARATTGNRMQFEVYKIDSSGTFTIIGTGTYDDGTAVVQTVSKTGLTEVINRNTHTYALMVKSGNTGAANTDDFYAAAITRTLP